MIGFNGGLIGKNRTTSLTAAVGVWTLNEQVRAQRSSQWPTFFDLDALAYITEVEVNDGNQTLESGVRSAINAFVVGCKLDGIWGAIKASCILAGARTLTGALTPLVGTAPTNNGPFVSGDYDRKTGLVGNASNKYLNSNRNNDVDPQNSRHLSVYVSTAATSTQFGGDIGYYHVSAGSYLGRAGGDSNVALSSPTSTIAPSSTVLGFRGVSRAISASYIYRASNTPFTVTQASSTPHSGNIEVFRGGGAGLEANSRLAFYSIGEDINLALLESRVTTLITDLAAAIP